MNEDRRPAKTFRHGAVGASIWQREHAAGAYFDVTFSRSWKSAENGETGYSQSFGADHLEALRQVALDAEAWIANARLHLSA